MLWFTADLHLGHTNVIKFENRPFKDTDEMNSKIINNWNSVVHPDDTIIVVGDFAFKCKATTKALLSCLNGKKILIRGNHDNNYGIQHYLNRGWELICEQMTLKLAGQNVTVSHYPYLSDNWMVDPHTGKHVRFLDRLPTNEGNWLIHGHVHSNWAVRAADKMICVSLENWNYTPISMKTLEKIIMKNSPNVL